MLETFVWDFKFADWRDGVPKDLGLLALQALASPF